MKKRKYAIIRITTYGNQKYFEFLSGFGMNRATQDIWPMFENSIKDPRVFMFYSKKEAEEYMKDIPKSAGKTKIIKVKRKDRRA